MKGYKVFNPDWTCRDFKYEVGKTYEHDGDIEVCERGFHFCQKASDCFSYYDFDSRNKVAEIEALGDVETDGNKSVTNKIKIVREIPWQEVLTIVNEGQDCTGFCNTGNRNTGNRNTGNCNTGNWNTGNHNTGDRNTGNCNMGNCNTGDCNMGNRNTGDWNMGDWNTGNWNTGDCNTGDWNTGNCNTGSRNTGSWNTGSWNTGNCNTGSRNTGDWNMGDWNTGNCNTGFFNTISPQLLMFDKPTQLTSDEIISNKGVQVLNLNFENNWWIHSANMSDEEKEQHPEHETTGGYLKSIPFKDACILMWDKLTDDEKQAVKEIPNFDKDVFFEITGIKVEE